ncbi:MAG: TrbI/VirB10 family protein [Novosphingobium sp.]|uniref:TrbI/VirB10 family protein n=1 Tax=Novosphingobium sp. TaxID=1874826 RepID=UPI001DE129FC|nr:TrbI/VirB10 family protein [Novosphingobium sp.]MCB2057142.1 TrbI/VirB10 family protein [Novosphingobium sp.]MCP5386001.1 TrbI/VirB10 family protein [Novosphingobium sp.]
MNAQVTQAPTAQAPDLSLRPPLPRVMRLSRKAIIGLCLAASAGIGGSLYYALSSGTRTPPENLIGTGSEAAADALASAPKDYTQVPKLGPPLPGDLGGPILAAQKRGDVVPIPPGPPQTARGPDPEEALRQRIAQERDAARTSRLFLGGGEGKGAGGPAFAEVPAAGVVSPLADAPANPSDQAGKRAFLKPTNTATTSAARLTGMVSPATLQAGSIIPAALITGIRSDLPGQITAQVTANVYDSLTGRTLLIPQGSRLIGEYDSEVSQGQNRVLLAWDRLIMPDGRSILLDRLPGADARGFAGLQDGVNYHWGNMARAAFISTLLGVGSELGAGGDSDLVRAVRRGTQDTISQTGQQIVGRELNVKPTLTIRPGFALRVMVTRDIILEPLGQDQRP